MGLNLSEMSFFSASPHPFPLYGHSAHRVPVSVPSSQQSMPSAILSVSSIFIPLDLLAFVRYNDLCIAFLKGCVLMLVSFALAVICAVAAVSWAVEIRRSPPDHYPLYRPVAWIIVLLIMSVSLAFAAFRS